MICENSKYTGAGRLEKPVCTNPKKAIEDNVFGCKCPIIYYCPINDRFEQTEQMLHCPYREGKDNDRQ